MDLEHEGVLLAAVGRARVARRPPARTCRGPACAALRCCPVTEVLLATDADWIHDEVGGRARRRAHGRPGPPGRRRARRPSPSARPTSSSSTCRSATWAAWPPASTCAWRPAPGACPTSPVLMLLDRRADVFLARRSDADGWLVKPLDAFRLRRAVTASCWPAATVTEGVPDDAPAPLPPDRRRIRLAGAGEAPGTVLAPTGWWRSLVARCVRDAEAGSSNLPHPTNPSEAAVEPCPFRARSDCSFGG